MASTEGSRAQSRAPSESIEVLGIEFQAPESCAKADDLILRIEERLPRLHFVEKRGAPIVISLSTQDSKIRAELVILLENKEELTRSIEATDCASALETISFIAAVALDPGAEQPLMIRESAPEEPLPSSGTTSSPDENSAHHSPSVARKLEWKLGAQGGAIWGPAPSALLGGELFVNLSHEQGGIWAPGFRLSVGYFRRGGIEEAVGVARFELFSATLDLCPAQWGGRSARLQFCASTDVGALRATGTETFQPGQEVRPWLALGGGLNGGFSPVSRLWIETRFGVVAPLWRDEFLFDESTFHQVWPVTLDLGLGAAFCF